MKKELMSYFRHNLSAFLLFFLFTGIFAIVFSLYHLPVEPVLYASILCVYAGIIFMIIDFIKYYKKHKFLLDLQKRITVNFDPLPLSKNQIEQDYIDIIHLLHDDRVQIISTSDQLRSDMVDYFTLWAHQIKTPIAAMHLLLQSAEKEQNTELSMELFKIEQYVEIVLQYLRLENIQSDLVLKNHYLDDIVKQAIRKYAKMFILKRIHLSYSPLNCEVLSDEKWLAFVVEQLLSNSIKYTKEGGTISIYLDSSSEKTLVIEDTGIGIASEDLPRVFEKGFTGYNGRSDKKSTGIGLYLCKQILIKLSHSLTIESEAGKGTKVFIHLATDKFPVK